MDHIELDENPSDARALLSRSEQLLDEGRSPESEALLRRGVEMFPDDPNVRLRAALAVRDSDLDLSCKWAREAGELGRTDLGIQFRVAQVLFDNEDFQGAADAAAAAGEVLSEDFPLMPELLHLAGRITLAVGGDDARAEMALREAFKSAPEELQHAQVLVNFYVERVQWKEAQQIANEARTWHPSDEYLADIQTFLRGKCGPTSRGRGLRPRIRRRSE